MAILSKYPVVLPSKANATHSFINKEYKAVYNFDVSAYTVVIIFSPYVTPGLILYFIFLRLPIGSGSKETSTSGICRSREHRLAQTHWGYLFRRPHHSRGIINGIAEIFLLQRPLGISDEQ